jgi:hypothetical protein
MSSVGDVIAQLRHVIERLDRAAVAVSGTQEDATRAHSLLTEVAHGTNHRQMRRAISESQIAGAKAGKVARLLGEAAAHFSAYADLIAPGSGLSRGQATEGPPSGDELLRQAEEKGSGVDRFIRRHVKKLDETEGNLQKAETAATEGVKKLFKVYKGQSGSTAAQVSVQQPKPVDRPQLEHPVTAVIIAGGAVAIGVKKLWEKHKKRHEGKAHGDQAGDGRVHPHDGAR